MQSRKSSARPRMQTNARCSKPSLVAPPRGATSRKSRRFGPTAGIGGEMSDYLRYLLDEETHVLKVEVASYDDDATALQWAEELCRDLPQTCETVEVWERDRFI